MQSKPSPRSVKKITSQNKIVDISVEIQGKELVMIGPAGPKRELSCLPAPLGSDTGNNLKSGTLPVLLGSGLGYALEALLGYLAQEQGQNFRLAVVDKEEDILTASELKRKYAGHPNIIWISNPNADEAIKELSKWQSLHEGKPFISICNPFYLRLDRAYYGKIRSSLEASAKANFWNRADYPKFKGPPRILLLTSAYFLIGDLEAACKRMGLEHKLLHLPEGEIAAVSFVEQLLEAVISFKPDFVLTINHLGVDREGILQDLLAKLRLPLASWFVDNPHLILYKYNKILSPWTTVLTWDADNLPSLKAFGFENVEYLPLATDHMRFAPIDKNQQEKYAAFGWQSRVSFVGNSMLHKVEARLKAANPPQKLRSAYKKIAEGFAESDERSVYAYMEKQHPDLLPDFAAMNSIERQLSFETLITWEATMRYRLECVKATLPFKPLIVGDSGWKNLLKEKNGQWRSHKELSYYTELPHFYPFSEVNFNCTSKQMKGAVNQRIFDVPATNSFVITDWREQIENLFEPGKEVVCYHSPEEATELVARYLNSPAERASIAAAARKRVLSEHLYEHRLQSVIKIMRNIYA